jgi:hypothetical protein
MYLNGVSCGTVAVGTNYTTGATSAQVLIGRMVDVTNLKFYGTLAGLRVSNTALYTAAFTPPSAPLTAMSGTN